MNILPNSGAIFKHIFGIDLRKIQVIVLRFSWSHKIILVSTWREGYWNFRLVFPLTYQNIGKINTTILHRNQYLKK
jgi:hypothetical protein